MNDVRHVRIFKNGRSRAVRIPKEFDIFEDEVLIHQEGDSLVLKRVNRRTPAEFIDWLRKQPPLGPDDEFPEIDDPLPEPVDFP